jgi:hypothetical protein
MRIIAFITDAPIVRAILAHLGEPATPPRIALARRYGTCPLRGRASSTPRPGRQRRPR